MSEPMTLQEACATTQQFARFLKGLERLREAADALAGADQLVLERQALAARLEEQITEAKKAVHEEIARAAQVAADAEAAADAVRASAAADVAKARDLATLAAADARAANEATVQAQREAAAALAEVEAATAELVAVRKKLEDAKAEARRRFGG